jgi:pimeloyl-ACP methyl ester carboxylesterase
LDCRKALFFCAIAVLSWLPAQARAGVTQSEWPNPDTWDLDPAAQASLDIDPVRENARSRDGLRLALKHFARPGAQPVLLIHGLAQNDRGWDSRVKRYSFARFLHAQGFDVWIGNLRGAGTAGFRSEAPEGSHHWDIDDYAINDVPGMVEAVNRATGQRPFVIGHSLAAWAIEGYLAGIGYDPQGRVAPSTLMSQSQRSGVRGVVTIAGVYNLRWEHPLSEAISNPIRSELDFYHSDYELELLARIKPLYRVIPNLPRLPLGWISDVLDLPLDKIPYIGDKLEKLYRGVQSDAIGTPLLSMFYYAPDCDHEMVREHALDGLEDLGPHVIEQLANAIVDGRTSSYYHLDRPAKAYDYADVRDHVDLPVLMVAGGRDRLASAYEIYQDGYLRTHSTDKQYIEVEDFGHLDIVTGIHAPSQVMAPVAAWMRDRL